MGRDRRRRRLQERRAERATPSETPATTPPRRPPRSGWRRTVDRWGGLPVVGSIAGALVVVLVLILLNLPTDEAEIEFEPTQRSQVSGRVEGAPDAPVRIVDVSDFQCPHCKTFAEETHPILLEEYVEQGLVSIEFHHLPVLGEASVRAAEAAECALDQERFWDMHDLLFLRQGSGFSYADLQAYGDELAEHFDDFDSDLYAACLDSGQKRQPVLEMGASAEAAGITRTPSFLVNGVLISGAQPIEVFREVIDEQLAASGGE